MKTRITLVLLFGLVASAFAAAQSHSAVLNWQDPSNPTTGTSYNIKRAIGLCSGTPTFSSLATAVTGLTYTDNTVTPGNYCYEVSATFSGAEGPASSPAPASVLPFAPVNLSVTVQQS